MTIIHEQKSRIEVSGIWLLRDGEKIIVRAEVNGSWIDVIREHRDAMFSHIVEPAGIRSCAALTSTERAQTSGESG